MGSAEAAHGLPQEQQLRQHGRRLKWLADGSISVDGLYMVSPPDDPQAIYQDLLHQRTERPAVVLDWTT
jgi:hypothetical protein